MSERTVTRCYSVEKQKRAEELKPDLFNEALFRVSADYKPHMKQKKKLKPHYFYSCECFIEFGGHVALGYWNWLIFLHLLLWNSRDTF